MGMSVTSECQCHSAFSMGYNYPQNCPHMVSRVHSPNSILIRSAVSLQLAVFSPRI